MSNFDILYAVSRQLEVLLHRHPTPSAESCTCIVHREASGALYQIPIEQSDSVKHARSMPAVLESAANHAGQCRVGMRSVLQFRAHNAVQEDCRGYCSRDYGQNEEGVVSDELRPVHAHCRSTQGISMFRMRHSDVKLTSRALPHRLSSPLGVSRRNSSFLSRGRSVPAVNACSVELCQHFWVDNVRWSLALDSCEQVIDSHHGHLRARCH